MKETTQALPNANAAKGKKSIRPGYSPFEAARRCGFAWPRFRKAMKAGQVEFIEFGGLVLVPEREIARIRALYGLSPTPEMPDEPPAEAEPLKSARFEAAE